MSQKAIFHRRIGQINEASLEAVTLINDFHVKYESPQWREMKEERSIRYSDYLFVFF